MTKEYVVHRVLKVRCFDEWIEASSKEQAIEMAIHADLWHDFDNAEETYEATLINSSRKIRTPTKKTLTLADLSNKDLLLSLALVKEKGGLKVITDLIDQGVFDKK